MSLSSTDLSKADQIGFVHSLKLKAPHTTSCVTTMRHTFRASSSQAAFQMPAPNAPGCSSLRRCDTENNETVENSKHTKLMTVVMYVPP